LSINSLNIFGGRDASNALQVTLSSNPSESILLTISARYHESNATVAAIGAMLKNTSMPRIFLPYEFRVKSNPRFLRQFISITLPSEYDSGYFYVSLSISGPSRDEFDVAYSNGRLIQIQSNLTAPEPPGLQSAAFSSDGLYIIVILSSSSDRGRKAAVKFLCSDLFVFSSSNYSYCVWNDDATVIIRPSSDDSINVGDKVTLLGNKVKALCTLSDRVCRSWPSANMTTALIEAPLNPISPVVSLSVPSTIGACSDIRIDVSSSYGYGYKRWSSVLFSVVSTASKADSINRFLASNYSLTTPTVIPAYLIQSQAIYVVTVRLCNFLGGCGHSSKRVVVSASSNLATVAVLGPAIRSFLPSTNFDISANAVMQQCSTDKALATISYSWSIIGKSNTGSLLETRHLISKSVSERKFSLPPYSIIAGAEYTITVTATESALFQSTSSSVTVYAESGDVVAIISGAADRQSIACGSI
jgi:hypothetical protein